MSLIPMRFRDWWDDWEDASLGLEPFRTSRLLDQHFGLGLNRNDLLSSIWGPSRSSGRRHHGQYRRPWVNEAMQRIDTGSTVKLNKDKFEVSRVNSINCFEVLYLLEKNVLKKLIFFSNIYR